MRFISAIVIFIMFSTILEASYVRSVRVGSFLNEDAADQSLYDLKTFVNSSYRLKDLRNEFGFELRTARSGRYYITVLEPITDRRAVQEILDIVRTVYPNAYPKKIKLSSRKYIHEVKPEPVVNQLELIENIDNMLEEEVVVNNIAHQPKIGHRMVETPAVVQHNVKAQEIQEPQNHKRFELKRTASLSLIQEDEEESDDVAFSIFGYEISMIDFSQIEMPNINFDFFTSEEKKESIILETKQDIESYDDELSIFENYQLEILAVITFFFFIILLKLIAMYRHNKEDQISIQDIYN